MPRHQYDYIVKKLYEIVSKRGGKLYLALTGGRDSRMILSIALHLKIPIEIVTFKINKKDVEIATKLCNLFKLEQKIININQCKSDKNKKNRWQKIIGDEFSEEDINIITKNALDSYMTNADCIIFGNGPEWASLTYAAGCENINSDAYNEYKKWIYKYPEEKIPLQQRLFLEIRVGSWLSSIQHSYDMCSNVQRFCFPLCEKIVANSFSLGKQRNKNQINESVVKLLVPKLQNINYS